MGIIINGLTDTVTAADGSLNIGGDVTIPGELSYDDVTNIDSVGIVTARAGINVTGGSLTVDAFSNTENNYLSLRNGYVPSASGGMGFMSADHSGANADGIAIYGHDGISLYAAQTERLRITSDGTLRQTGSSNALGQGTSVAKLTHYTIDGTTPGGVGDVTTLETISATSNGSDYRFRITKREGSGGGSCYFDLGGNSDGSISFGTNTSGSATERLRITSGGQLRSQATYDGSGTLSDAFPCLNLNNLQGSYTANNFIGGVTFGKAPGHSNGIRAGMLALYASTGSLAGNVGVQLSFRTSTESGGDSQERLRIRSDGKLMTQSAGYVYTASSSGSLSLYGGNTNLGGGIVLSGGNTNGDIRFYAQMSTATPAERLRITSDGAIAVGDASQMGSNYARISIDCQGRDVLTDVTDITKYGLAFHNDPNTNDANGIGFFNDDGQACGGYILHQDKGSNNLGDLIFGTSATSNNPAERLRITSGGNVGINHADPNTRLYVKDTGADISNGNAIFNSTQKGIRLEVDSNDDKSLGLWFSTGSHHSGISGQRTNYAAHWGTDLRFYTHEAATNDLTYTRERHRITCNGLLTNRKGQNAVNTGGSILGRYKYTQLNQGSGYAHLILAPDGRKLQDYITTNCYCIITVTVTGTGTDNMFCQYYYWATSSANIVNLTHMYGNSGASSNRPYMNLQNSSDPAWLMSHNGQYRLDIEVAIYGGAEAYSYTTEYGDFTTNP